MELVLTIPPETPTSTTTTTPTEEQLMKDLACSSTDDSTDTVVNKETWASKTQPSKDEIRQKMLQRHLRLY